MSRPAPRQVRTWQHAEQLAEDWMRYFGYTDARLTCAGPDGGVDIKSCAALAQVKFRASQVGAPDMQRLFGARGAEMDKGLLFFTGSSYSAKALAYAEQNGIALFVYDLVGNVTAANGPARSLEERADRVAQQRAVSGPPHGSRDKPLTGRVWSREEVHRGVIGPPSPPMKRSPLGDVVADDPTAAGCLAAFLLLIPGTLLLLGAGALIIGPAEPGLAVVLTVVGFAAYAAAVRNAAVASRRPRSQWRWPRGLLVVVAIATPAAGLWLALALHAFDSGDGVALFIVAALMLPPFVVVGLSKPSKDGLRR